MAARAFMPRMGALSRFLPATRAPYSYGGVGWMAKGARSARRTFSGAEKLSSMGGKKMAMASAVGLAAAGTVTAMKQPRSTTWLLSDDNMSLDMITNEQKEHERLLEAELEKPEEQSKLIRFLRWLTRMLLIWGGTAVGSMAVVNLVRDASGDPSGRTVWFSVGGLLVGVAATALGLTWTLVHEVRRFLDLDDYEANLARYEKRLHCRPYSSMPYCMQESFLKALQFLNGQAAAASHGFSFELLPNAEVYIEENAVRVRVYVAARQTDAPHSLFSESLEALNISKTLPGTTASLTHLIFPIDEEKSMIEMVFRSQQEDLVSVKVRSASCQFASSFDFTDGITFLPVEEGKTINKVRFFQQYKVDRDYVDNKENAHMLTADIHRFVKRAQRRRSP